jgi:integrase
MSFSVQHSYYWRRGGHLKATKTEASAKVLPMHLELKDALLEWKSQTEYKGPGDFVFPSLRCKGKKPLDLAAVLKTKIQPAFASVGILGVGWHAFRRTVGTMLAEMGEHQLTRGTGQNPHTLQNQDRNGAAGENPSATILGPSSRMMS